MAQSRNFFALLDTEEEDASSIVVIASAATVKVEKIEENNKPQKTNSPVNNSMMTKSNRNILPDHVSRPVITKEKPEREGSVGDYRKKTENRHPVANGNGNSNNRFFNGNFKGSNNPRNTRNNYGGFQGNSRRNYGYDGNSRAPNNQYRNHRFSSNDLQGNVGGTNVQKTENLVDAEGWQIYHGRRGKAEMEADNHSQNGEGFNGYGGDRRWMRSYRGNDVNNEREEEKSDVCEKEVDQNGEIVSLNGTLESKNPDCEVEAAKDSNEISNVNEGEKDCNMNSKTEGDEAQKNSKKSKKNSKYNKKKQDDDEKETNKKQDDDDDDDDENKIRFTLKEYEKMQLENRKALESLKQAEQRKVDLDKDFESMLLVDKKKNEEQLELKQNSGVAKKKESSINGDKIGKVRSIQVMKPSYREEWMRRRRNERVNTGSDEADKLNEKKKWSHENGKDEIAEFIVDVNQFPALGGGGAF